MGKIIRKHWSVFAKIFFLAFFFVALIFGSKLFYGNPQQAKGSWLATTTWIGGATGNWQNAANWTAGIPSSTALADISSSTAVTITATGTINFDTLRVGGGTASSTLILVGNIGTGIDVDIKNNGKIAQSSTVQQTISGTLLIESGGRLTHSANTSTQARVINFNANTITEDAGGIVSSTAGGYSPVANGGNGPGAGQSVSLSGGGGGHGGNGADDGAAAGGQGYCDITNLNTIGSAGGSGSGISGGFGGGLIILTATGTITLNGIITANGGNGSSAGGGAGGGIKITADTIAGTPQSFTANGGNGGFSAAGGGGGCVFIGYTTSNTITPTSTYFSINGGGSNGGTVLRGGGGIALVKQSSANGVLYALNVASSLAIIQPSSTVSAITADFIYVSSSIFQVTSSKTFTLASSSPFLGDGTGEIRVYGSIVKSGGVFDNVQNLALTVESGASITVSSTFTVSSSLNLYKGFIGIATDTFTNLTIQSGTTTVYNYTTSSAITLHNLTANGGFLTHGADSTTQDSVLNISATSTITINSGGTITASGTGYAGGSTSNGNGQGPGAGISTANNSGAGGGHGGDGALSVTSTGGQGYCDITNINTVGSGGAGSQSSRGGWGGGLIILSATGTITINGSVIAGGAVGGNAFAGGGGGGGIKITADIINGTPINFSAPGGNGGSSAVGGGGGCIDIFYTTSNTITPTSSYFSVSGGTPTTDRGGGGMAFVKQTGVSSSGTLYVLNSGSTPALTQPSSTVPAITADFIYVSSSIFQVTSSKTFTLTNSDPFSGDGTGEIRVYGSMVKSGGAFNSIHDVGLTVESGGSVSVSSTFTASSTLNLYRGFIGISADTFTNLIIQSGTTTVYNYNTSTVPLSLTTLTINSSSALSAATNTTAQTHIIYVVATSTITINAGGSVFANGSGYSGGAIGTNSPGNGPGAGGGVTTTAKGGGGGAHGGNGGAGTSGTGGTAYCSSTNPASIGSGGGGSAQLGGAGGNLIWLSAVSSTITINGNIKANGNNTSAAGGGGAGGGIKLIAKTVTGTPQAFTANGGNGGSTGGGGGGGCIYIQYTLSNTVTSTVATTTGGSSGTGTAGSAGTFQTSNVDSAPTVTNIFPSQTSANIVTVTTTISDVDLTTTTLYVFYSTNGTTWVSSTLANVTEGGVGDGVATSTSTGIITGIDTDNSGSINLTFEWNVAADLPNTESSSIYIKIIPNDGISNGTAVSSTAFSIDTKAPTAPGNLVLFSTSTQSARFTFGSASADANFREYIIYYKAGSSGVTVNDTAFTSSSDSHLGFVNYNGATSTSISGLATSTQYVFNIWAYDVFSRSSTAAAEVVFYTLAATPQTLVVTNATTNTLDIAVAAGDTNPTAVQYAIQETGSGNYVQTNGTLGASAAWQTKSNWGTKTVTGLSTSTAYTFKVKARNGDNVETSFSATLTSSTLAVTPLAPTINNPTTTTLDVAITAGDTNSSTTEYAIQETGSGNYVQTNGTLGASAAWQTKSNWGTKTVTGLSTSTAYTFKVKARNGDNVETSFSATTTLYTAAAIPSAPTVSGATTTSLNVAITAGDTNSSSIEYAIQDVSSTNYVQTDGTLGASAVWKTKSNWGTKTVIGLATSTVYKFRAKARNADNTETNFSTITSLYTLAAIPFAPTLSNVSSSTLNIAITAGDTNSTSVEYAIQDVSSTNYVQSDGTLGVSAVWKTSSSWGTETVNSLTSSTLYTFRVKARNGDNVETAFSATISTTTLVNNHAPTVTAIFPAQTSFTTVTVTTTITDIDLNTTTLAIVYSTNGTTWTSSTLAGVSENGEGNGVATTTGSITGIDTNLDGSVDLTIQWNIGVDLPNTESSTIYLKITPNDGTIDGTAVSSTAFSIDTKAPTAPGSLVLFNTSTQSATLTFGSAATDGNFIQYIIYYKAGSSGVTVNDTAFTSSSDSHLGFINYNGATSTTITGLATSTQYVFNIWAYDGFSNTAAASERTFYTLAAPPLAPTLSGQTTTTLNITITAGDTNPTSVEYAIQETSSTNYLQSDGTLGAAAVWATKSSWGTKTVVGLAANTSYSFKTKARNGNNVETAFSAATSTTSLANNVLSLVAVNSTITSTYRIGLSWTNAGQTGMKSERDNGCDGTYDVTLYDNSAANDTSPTTTLSSLQANTCYRFRISSYNSSSTLNTTDVTVSNDITTPPAAPANVTAVSVTTSTITWGWDAVTGATTYYVYDASNNALLDTVSVTSSLQSGLSVSTTYSVFVRAANSNGTGVSSSIATAITGPAAPTGLAAASRTTSTITWTWTNGGQYQFFAQDKNNNSNNSGWISVATWTQTGLTANTAYTLQVKARDVSSTESGYTEITRYTMQNPPTSITFVTTTASTITLVINGSFINLGAGSSLIHIDNGVGVTQDLTATTTWQNTSLNAGTQYTYTTYAVNGDGLLTASTTGSKYTLAATPSAPTVFGPSTSTLHIAITAGDSNSAIVEYAILETGSGNYVQADGSFGASAYWANTSTWGNKVVTGLSVNTQYTFKAKARNAENTETDFGATASLYTFANVPGAPTLGNASASSLSVAIDTNNNPSYTTYSIYNNTAGNFTAADGSATSSAVWQTSSTWGSGYIATGLSPNTSYNFSVLARNGDNVQTDTSTISTAKFTLASTPSSVSAVANSRTEITLSWTGDATSSYAENITAGTNSGWISASSYTFTDLTCGTLYSFRVKGINGEGIETAYSSTVSATTSACQEQTSGGGSGFPTNVSTTPTPTSPPPETPTSTTPTTTESVPSSTSTTGTVTKNPTTTTPVVVAPPLKIIFVAVGPAINGLVYGPQLIFLKIGVAIGGILYGPAQITSSTAPTQVVVVPEKQLIDKTAPLSMRGLWTYIDPVMLNRFVFAPLPKEFLVFENKIPQVRNLMSQIGVNRLSDMEKLDSASVYLPGLNRTMGLNQPTVLTNQFGSSTAVALDKAPSLLKNKIPANIIFAQIDHLVDLGVALSFNKLSYPQQTINTVSGKPLQLTIKPDHPVSQIKGYLLYEPKVTRVNPPRTIASLVKDWLFGKPAMASTTDPQVQAAPIEKKLVLLEFAYTDPDKDGIYTATITAPVPAGQYKILTIIDYQDPEFGSRQVELVAVVDPEGRVYENVNGQQLIISGAVVTLYHLNPDTQKYEVWAGKDFLQANPIITDAKGVYSFLVPDGNYYIKAEAPGYLAYEGSPFTVQQGGGIHTDIQMKPKYWGLKVLDWKTGLVALLAIFLAYFFLKERKLEKKEKKLEELLEKK